MTPAEDERAIARALRLRGPLPPVVRLSRTALLVSAGFGGVGLAAALAVATIGPPARETAETPAAPVAEAPARPPEQLAGLPKDYGRSRSFAAPPEPPPPAAAEARGDIPPPTRAAVEGRGAALFAQVRAGSATRTNALAAPSATSVPGTLMLPAGLLIEAALVADAGPEAGPLVAQVTADVHERAGERRLLAPAGSRLLGVLESRSPAASRRPAAVWTRLLLPGGRSVDLPRESVLGEGGSADLPGETTQGWGRMAGAALTGLALSITAALGARSLDDEVGRAVGAGVADTAGRAVGRVVDTALDAGAGPRLRAGTPVALRLSRDVQLPPGDASWPND